MFRFSCASVAITCACGLLSAQAQAGPIFSLSASRDLSDLSPGDQFTVSVNVAGLDPLSLPDFLGAEVLFESSLLSVTSDPVPGDIIDAGSLASFVGFSGAGPTVGFAGGFYDEIGSPVTGDGVFFSFGLEAAATGSGQLRLNPDPLATFVFGADAEVGPALDFTVAADNITPIPEPSSLVLLGLGIVGLAARRRTRPHPATNRHDPG